MRYILPESPAVPFSLDIQAQISIISLAAPSGELAAPCTRNPLYRGPIPRLRSCFGVKSGGILCIDGWVSCSRLPQTPSGSEESSGIRKCRRAAKVPGRSKAPSGLRLKSSSKPGCAASIQVLMGLFFFLLYNLILRLYVCIDPGPGKGGSAINQKIPVHELTSSGMLLDLTFGGHLIGRGLFISGSAMRRYAFSKYSRTCFRSSGMFSFCGHASMQLPHSTHSLILAQERL